MSLVVALAAAAPAYAVASVASDGADAASGDASPAAPVDKHEIVVVAERLKGQVEAPQQPIVTMDEVEIASYGVTSISDLLDAISAQTGSGRGRGATSPVILVNGMRIASFRELRDYPPEAIRKVEILPEEVALRYGYSPDQRVVNFILKDHYFARTGELEFIHPDGGGSNTTKGQASVLKIDKGRRLNLTLRADHTTPTTEAEHAVIQSAGSEPTVASDPDPAASRTLVSDTKDYSVNGTYTIPLGEGSLGGNVTLNGTASRTDTNSLSGLNAVSPATGVVRTFAGPLTRFSRTDTYNVGASVNKSLLDWQLSTTLDTSHAEASTTTANRASTASMLSALATNTPLVSAGTTISNTTTNGATALVTLVGRPVALPAGKLSLTVKGGFAYSDLAGSTSTGGVQSTLRRGDASAGVNIGVPITSRREHVGEALGDITLNLSAGGDQLSDFGSLLNWTGGVTWNVTPKLGLQSSYIYNEAAPSLSNLGAPLVTTPNVSVFDFVTGKSVLATVYTGGNPALVRERRNDIKLGMNWMLPAMGGNSNLIVEYFNNRSNNVSSAFPSVLTTAMEAAFPGRVTRDGTGAIVSINRSAVTLAEQREERIRWGFNLGGNLGKPVASTGRGMFGAGGPPMGGGRPGGGFGGPPPGGPGGGGAGGPPGAGGPGGGRGPRYDGRWNLSIYHTVQFVDRVLVAPGGPVLNLLGGDALSGGGVARHSLEIDGGGFWKGLGLRLNGTWSAPTHVDASGAPGTSDLRFGALFKMNGRLFIDLGQQQSLVKDAPFFKGARLSLMANNLFDQRQKVTDNTGTTPLSYQPAILDANGRLIGVEFRKLF